MATQEEWMVYNPSRATTRCEKCAITELEHNNPLKWCAKCKITRYCSINCQRADWKQHKTVCNRYTKRGKCYTCKKPEVEAILSPCRGCMGDVYCSSDCQEKDWMRHKVVCSKNRKNDRRCIDCKTTESPRNPLAWCFSCRASGNLFCNLECHQRDWERQESNAGKSYDEVHKRFTENTRGEAKERDYIFRMLTSKDLTGEGGDYRPTFKTGLIHTLSKEDAHCFLVDTFRFGASGSEPFLIGGTSMTSFGKFLDKVELFGLLPAWWSPDERRKCEEEARSRDDRATLDPFTSHELRKVMELDGLMEGLGIDSDQDDSEADSVD